jgi:hypothetical protein
MIEFYISDQWDASDGENSNSLDFPIWRETFELDCSKMDVSRRTLSSLHCGIRVNFLYWSQSYQTFISVKQRFLSVFDF